MTDASAPEKRSKAELEQLVKANGGKIFQTNTAVADIICIAERRTVKVASLQKHGNINIIKPSWILDCVKQNEKDVGLPDLLLPFEPRYFEFRTAAGMERRKEAKQSILDICSSQWRTETMR